MANWRAGTLTLLLLMGVVVSTPQTPAWSPGSSDPGSPQQQPVFRGGTTVVPLTVTVVDQKGVPITDLKQSDFRVYENKSQREILNFFPQALVPGLDRVQDDGISPESHRRFVLVIGEGNVFNALGRTIAFVRGQLLPQDEVALMAIHRTTPFTVDHELVARILERYKTEHGRLFNDLWKVSVSTMPALFGSRKPDDPRVLAARAKVMADIDAMLDGIGPLRDTSDLLFGMDAGVPLVDNVWQRQETFADVVNALGGASLAGLVAGSNRFKLVAGVELMRYLDGERHIVFLSSGGLARDEDDVKMVARRATDAHVVVDMIGSNGLDWLSRDVVEQTGGYYSSLDYADKALAKIERRSRFSYLLGYDPFNPMLDGKYREVDVKVNRPGVAVRFSHGYYARAAPDPIDVKELIVKSRVVAALAYASTAKDITLGVTAYLLPRMGIQAQARVEITIDASQLVFETKDGIRTDQLELQVYCGDAKEVIVGEFGERLDLEAAEATYEQWAQTGIRRTVRVPLMGTPKFVKVMVYDYGSDRVGSFILSLKPAGK